MPQLGPMGGMAPRPGSNGGIMGGQPQAPRPMQQPMMQAAPMRQPPGQAMQNPMREISLAPGGMMRRPM